MNCESRNAAGIRCQKKSGHDGAHVNLKAVAAWVTDHDPEACGYCLKAKKGGGNE